MGPAGSYHQSQCQFSSQAAARRIGRGMPPVEARQTIGGRRREHLLRSTHRDCGPRHVHLLDPIQGSMIPASDVTVTTVLLSFYWLTPQSEPATSGARERGSRQLPRTRTMSTYS